MHVDAADVTRRARVERAPPVKERVVVGEDDVAGLPFVREHHVVFVELASQRGDRAR